MDALLAQFAGALDAVLIAPFRLPPSPLAGFLLGSACLAMGCVVLGEFVLSIAIRCNRRQIDALKGEIARQEALSILAYEQGETAGYKALNHAANDAWGRHFFTMAAYSAGMLWPVPFALAWLHTRFHSVAFELPAPLSWVFGDAVSYPFVFIPVYILCRIVFGRLRSRLPYFKGVHRMLSGSRSAAGSGSGRSG